MKQKTLKGSFSLFGKGLHTGLNLTVTFNPAPENTGYKIKRIDLEGEPVIDAIAENVIDTQRGTVLGKGDVRIYGREDIRKLCDNAGLHMESFEKRGFCRLHCVVRKTR